jgi:hypothetical protein
MRKIFSKFLALLPMLSFLSGNATSEKKGLPSVKAAAESNPRFVAGDHFYKHLSFKRVKGKWRVKK